MRVDSPYYPPRKGWRGRLLAPWDDLHRRWRIYRSSRVVSHDSNDDESSFVGFFEDPARIFVPGYSYIINHQHHLGFGLLAAYGLLVGIYIVFLGSNLADMAGSMAVTLHAISAFRGLRPNLVDATLRQRIAFYGCTILLLVLIIYAPLVYWGQGVYVLPVQRAGQPIVLNVWTKAARVHVGDMIGYNFTGFSFGHNYMQAGLGVDPVLAMPGSTVRFFKDRYEIDGRSFKKEQHMPSSGEYKVPDKHWFVWPSLFMNIRNVSESDVLRSLTQTMMVDQNAFVGKAFKRWFFRNQTYESL